MKVTWTVDNFEGKVIDPPQIFDGEVLGVTRSTIGVTYLVVACSDGKVREVPIWQVTCEKQVL